MLKDTVWVKNSFKYEISVYDIYLKYIIEYIYTYTQFNRFIFN